MITSICSYLSAHYYLQILVIKFLKWEETLKKIIPSFFTHTGSLVQVGE